MAAKLVAGAAVVLVAAGCGGSGKIADGRHFAYLKSVDTTANPPTLEVDLADFLVGAAAKKAAAAAGEDAETDYYIRNPDRRLRSLQMSDDVRVTVVQCPTSCREGFRGDFSGLAASFADKRPKSFADRYRGAQSQYWLTTRGGVVTRIDEQYLP